MRSKRVVNQIFVGYPWKTYRAHWEKVVAELHKWSPISLLAIGRTAGQPALQLLSTILQAIDRSSAACFDVSAGNANVALELGYALGTLGREHIYIYGDENATASRGPGSPIISDLAGAVHHTYALNDSRLEEAVRSLVDSMPYARRFDKFCGERRYRGGTRRFLIRIVRQLDGKQSILRRELLDNVTQQTTIRESKVLEYLNELRDGGLLTISRGNRSSCRVSIRER